MFLCGLRLRSGVAVTRLLFQSNTPITGVKLPNEFTGSGLSVDNYNRCIYLQVRALLNGYTRGLSGIGLANLVDSGASIRNTRTCRSCRQFRCRQRQHQFFELFVAAVIFQIQVDDIGRTNTEDART